MQVSASSYAQKITLEVRDVQLEKVVFEIQRQSGYDFLYSSQLIKMAKPVSLSVKNVPLSQALDKFFARLPISSIRKPFLLSPDQFQNVRLSST